MLVHVIKLDAVLSSPYKAEYEMNCLEITTSGQCNVFNMRTELGCRNKFGP